MGHGEEGSVEDRKQFEVGGVPKPLSRGPRKGFEGLGSLGSFLLHCVFGSYSFVVCIGQEGKTPQQLKIFPSLSRFGS